MEDSGRNRGGDDLMGVHGDVLFADPLNIRKDKGAAPKSSEQSGAQRMRAPQASREHTYDLDTSRDDDLDMNLPAHRRAEINRGNQEESQEEAGPVRAWFGYLFGGGTQCCGNRDRNKDSELAKKASSTGRPPTRQDNFPAAPSKAMPSNDANGRRRGEANSLEDSYSNAKDEKRQRDDPFAMNGKRPAAGGNLDELHKFVSDSNPPRDPPQKPPEERRPVREEPKELPKPQGSDQLRRPSPQEEARVAASEKPPAGHLPRSWQWPSWTLNTKQASIEVYVTDDESNESRWCEAEPQFRVVDKEGNDAYLCAEYEWDGEYYVQDFGPHHVRKRGQDMTVFQMFALDPENVQGDDFLKDTSKSMGRRNLDDTDPFMTTRPRGSGAPASRLDSGGGVSSWLEND
jgi:hypothetical protein